jgi:hypothetical protein
MSKHHEMDTEEEEKLFNDYRKIVDSYEQAKSKGILPNEGSFKGLNGNRAKGWAEQIRHMKARIERYTREHGKKNRHQHR